MAKLTVVYPYDGVFLSNKEKQALDTSSNADVVGKKLNEKKPGLNVTHYMVPFV